MPGPLGTTGHGVTQSGSGWLCGDCGPAGGRAGQKEHVSLQDGALPWC